MIYLSKRAERVVGTLGTIDLIHDFGALSAFPFPIRKR